MTLATAAVSFHRRGTHRRLADRDFFQSFGPVFGDGDDGDDDDDDGEDDDRGGHTSSTSTSTSAKQTTQAKTTTTSTTHTVATSSDQKTSTTSKTSTSTTAQRTSTSSSSQTSSKTSSSSSSSTFSSTSSSTSSSSRTVSKTQLATTSALSTTSARSTLFLTSTVPPPSNSATLTGAADAAQSTSPKGGASTGAIVGGVAAGVVGLFGLVLAVVFLMRRKKSEAPLDDFDPHSYDGKHRSVILPDEGILSRNSSINHTRSDYDDRSLNTEQQIAAVPPSFGGSYAGYGADSNCYNHSYAPYQAQYNYGPGQYMNMPSTPTTPYAATPTSATPFMHSQTQAPPYGVLFQAPGSPVTRQPSSGPAQYLDRNGSMNALQNMSEPATPDPAVTRQPSMGAASALSRGSSMGSGQVLSRQGSLGPDRALNRTPLDITQGSLYRQPSDLVTEILHRQRTSRAFSDEHQVGPDAHYVDLNRSSVTPFQQQQYSEISHRLNIPPPGSQPVGIPEEFDDDAPLPEPKGMKDLPSPRNSLPPAQLANPPRVQGTSGTPIAATPSPFADPEEVTVPGHLHVIDFPVTPQTEESFGPLPSPGRFLTYASPKFDELPLPSPALTDRVPSTPPVLPEIHLQERAFSPVSSEYPNSLMSTAHAANFDLPSPLPQAHFIDDKVASAKPDTPGKLAPSAAEAPGVKRPDTVYSVATEDAYDGI